MTEAGPSFIPIIIVAYNNDTDVRSCVAALSRLNSSVRYDLFVCENGGAIAFDRLIATLTRPDGPCDRDSAAESLPLPPRLQRVIRLRFKRATSRPDAIIQNGEAKENFGYAGGVNCWLRPLLDLPDWRGVWILNPDTEAQPDALTELVEYANRHDRCMVGSRLCPPGRPDIVHSRGLTWRKWRAAPLAVDYFSPAATSVAPDVIDRKLDAASGASTYVPRDWLNRIGLMDEGFFLYFEDMDWGLRAKKLGGLVGYADGSFVTNVGGTTIGSSPHRAERSPLSIYLDFRNRILFVRRHFPYWLPWTALISLADVALYLFAGAFRGVFPAVNGLLAGLLGRTGRPDRMVRNHCNKMRTPSGGT